MNETILGDYERDADATRAIKAALRKAFPSAKFPVTRGGRDIRWTDDGPTVVEVENALIAGGCEAGPAWNGQRRLNLPGNGNTIYFDRYNAAERAADEAERERRRQEDEEQQQRENEAVRQAELAKREAMRAAMPALPVLVRGTPAANDPEVHAAFEALRRRAEAAVACDVERKVRPSWAPPLILAGELLDVCRALGWLAADDAPIARLWASFADPKAGRSVLREWRSHHPLSGIQCRGFQLHAGGERGSTDSLLFEAQRTEMGQWQFGPRFYARNYYSPRVSEWTNLVRERERLFRLSPEDQDIARKRIAARLAEIEAEDLAAEQTHYRRQHLHMQALELAKARVLDFAGAPGAQMALAGRLCGHCFNCFRELTDPISLEHGIGPECLEGKVAFIKSRAAEMDVDALAFWTGMPAEFVGEVLAERGRP